MATVVKSSSDRIHKLREKVRVPRSICVERGYWMTESYKETENEPYVLRRAKAVGKILKEITVSIEDGELIVGRATSKARGAALIPEIQWRWYLDEMESLSTREWDRFAPLTEEEKTILANTLSELRMGYVKVAEQVEKKDE